MNILFFGSSKHSLIVLKKLLSSFKDSSFKIITTTKIVSLFCKQHHIPITSFNMRHRAPQMNDIDLIISADFGLKIPSNLLKKAKIGALNLHPSLLPKYRGAAPIPWALLKKELKTGISLIEMTDKIDSGPILAQQTIPISPQDTSETLLKRCFTTGAKLLVKTLPDYIDHKITPKPQPVKSPTPYARRFTKKDGYLSWPEFVKHSQNQFQSINHQIKALYPWPGVHTKMPNLKVLKLLPDNRLQLEGKNPISLKAFLAGYKHLLQ